MNGSTQPGVTLLLGNTAGISSVMGARPAYFSGGSNVTLSGISDTGAYTLRFDAAAGGTGGGGGIALAAGTQTATTNTVAFANSNGLTFGMSGSSQVTASHNGLTTAALSDHSHGNPSLALTNISGTTASNSAGLTLSLSAAAPGAGGGIAAAAGTQTQTSGTLVFANSNGLTFGMSGSSQVTGSHNGLTTAALSDHSHGNPTLNLTNLSGTTASASNGLTLSLSGPPAGLTTARASNDAVGLATAATSVTWTVNSAGISLNAGAYLTTAALSNHSHAFATTTTGGASIVVGTSNSAGVTIGVPSYLTTARASTDGVGLATAQTNVTWTVNSAGVSLNAGGYAGTGTSATNASVTLNSNGLAISVAAPGGGAAQTFSAGTASGAANPVTFSNANGVSFGYDNGTITASVNAGGGGAPNRSYIQIIEGERMTSVAALSATQWTRRIMFQPFWMDGTGMVPSTARMLVSNAGSSNRSLGGTFHCGLYSQVNSSQMTRLTSQSVSYSITASSQSSAYQGAAFLDFTGMTGTTFTAEGRYMFAFLCDPVSANVTWMPMTLWGADPMPVISRILTNNTTTATGNTGVSAFIPWWGVYSATTNAMPGSVALSQVNGGNSGSLPDIYAVLRNF